LVKLAALAMTRSDQAWLDSCGRRDDLETLALLRRHGISPNAIERFLRPFFGGVFLDNSLSASGSLFFYYLKKFATGRAVVPSGGMGALSAHLARGLTDVRLLSPVSGFQVTKGRVEKVHLAEGSSVDVEGVILATDLQAARALIPTDSPAPAFASVWTVFFEAEESLYSDRLIVLPAGARRVVRHFVQITNVAPGYSQTGRPLLMATILNPGTRHAVALASVAEREIKEVFPNASLELVDIHRVDRAVPLQPPSYFQAPRAKSPFANLVIAGDGIHSSSIEAAMHSGERAALALRPFQKSQGERASRPF
jgi:protoporphyrinogen oxidase